MAKYFYASGERVPIERDDTQAALVTAKLSPERRRGVLAELDRSGARSLQGQVVVLPKIALDAAITQAEAATGALQSVYRRGKELLVALPEVRVELDDAAQLVATREALADAPHPVDVLEESEDRIVLVPQSGSADDALDVANYLHERARPAAASVRFLHFVAKPRPAR
jgi:hypothetical protein